MFPVREGGAGSLTLWVGPEESGISLRASPIRSPGFTVHVSLLYHIQRWTSGLSGLTQRKVLKEHVSVGCHVKVLESFYLV